MIYQEDSPRPGSDVMCPIAIGDSIAYRAEFEVENEVEVAQTLWGEQSHPSATGQGTHFTVHCSSGAGTFGAVGT